MKIEAICAWSGNPALPEYLVRVSHKEALMLGATAFQPGEHLDLVHHMSKSSDALREIALRLKNVEDAAEIAAKSKGGA